MADEPSSDDAESNEKNLEQNEEDLWRKLENISERLTQIERVLARIEPEMGEFKQSTRVIREGMDFYGSLFNLMGRFSGRQRIQRRFPEIAKDEISRLIIGALEEGKAKNISELTSAVRQERGTASRRIVRNRVHRLVEMGVVQKAHTTKKATYYKLAEGLIWAVCDQYSGHFFTDSICSLTTLDYLGDTFNVWKRT